MLLADVPKSNELQLVQPGGDEGIDEPFRCWLHVLQSSPMILIAFIGPPIYVLLSRVVWKFLLQLPTYERFLLALHIYRCPPTATKYALHGNFTYVHENVILLGKSRLRALAVLIFAHDNANSNSASAVQTGLWLDN